MGAGSDYIQNIKGKFPTKIMLCSNVGMKFNNTFEFDYSLFNKNTIP